MLRNQKGMGVMEILFSLLLLSVGVMGLVMVQVKAIEASSDNLKSIVALNLAKSLTEQMRSNPSEYSSYKTNGSRLSNTSQMNSMIGSRVNCYNGNCTPSAKAQFDITEAYIAARDSGYNMAMVDCPNGSTRFCIYVAWGGTLANDCASYSGNRLTIRERSKCVILEAI